MTMHARRPEHNERRYRCGCCDERIIAPDYAAIWRGIRVGLAMVAPFWLIAFLALILFASGAW